MINNRLGTGFLLALYFVMMMMPYLKRPCLIFWCQDSYSMFGVPFRADDQIIRPLESQSLPRLYPHNYDHKRELKKLNFSILVNFLDLLDILIKAPDSQRRVEKIDDLTLLFIHMHHLINEFRPHQARETLRVMLEVQKRQRLETVDRFQKHFKHVQEMLQNCLASLPDDSSLDTKLIINTNLAGGPDEGLQVAVKEEPEDDENEEDLESATLDEMMCDIVDALN